MRIPSKNNEPPLIASPRKSGNLQFFEDSSSILNIEQGKRSTPTGFVDPSTVLARGSQDPQMAELHPPPYAEQQAPQQVQAAQNQPTVSKKISFSQQSAGLHYFRDKKSTAEHIMQTGNSSGLMKIIDVPSQVLGIVLSVFQSCFVYLISNYRGEYMAINISLDR